MKHYLSLIGRYLSHQRRRTALALAGIACAVALVAAAGVLAASIQETIRRQTAAAEGAFHAAFYGLDVGQLDRLRTAPEVASVGVEISMGTAQVEKLALAVEAMDPTARELRSMTLSQGRFPKEAGEVALEGWAAKELGLEISSTLSLQVAGAAPGTDGQLQSYGLPLDLTVVGILVNTQGGVVSGWARALLAPEAAALLPVTAVHYNATVLLTGRPEEQAVERLRQELQLEKNRVYWHKSLFDAGQGKAARRPVLLLGGLVLLTGVATIYNVFHIAVLERIRQLGTLRSLGATPAQVRRLVLGEAVVLALLAIPLGLLAGVGAAFGLARGLTLLQGLAGAVVVPGWALAVAAGVGLLVTLLSALAPASFAGRLSPLEAMQGRGQVLAGSSTRSRRWHHWLRAVAGLTGQLAYQNMWRNRRRTAVSLFSLGLSVALFIVVTTYAASTDVEVIVRHSIKSDYALVDNTTLAGGGGYDPAVGDEISRLPGVAEVIRTRLSFVTTQPSSRPEQSDSSQVLSPSGSAGLTSLLLGYDEPELAELSGYVLSGRVDPAEMAQEPAVLVVDPELKSGLAVGDQLPVRAVHQENGATVVREKTLRVAAVLSDLPASLGFTSAGPDLVVSARLYEELVGSSLYQRLDVTAATGADLAELEEQLRVLADQAPQGRLICYEEMLSRQLQEGYDLLTLFYGLVGMILVIGVLNIVNTLTTNLVLRTGEFGMLRAVGMTEGQLRQMTRLEGLLYGLFSSLWGVALGSALAYLLVQMLKDMATYLTFTLPWPAILLAGLASIGLGVLATLLPTRRIAALTVVEAVRGND